MRLALLGQSLITQDLRKIDWPGRAAIKARLRCADAVFTDLEVALQGCGSPTREGNFLHTAPPSVLDCLADLGIGLLGLANNHAWDLGTDGLQAARLRVVAQGFACAGSGVDMEHAFAPGFANTPNGRVGLVCFAAGKIREGAAATQDRPGVAELRIDDRRHPDAADMTRILAAIRNAAGQSEAVIACLHNHFWEEDPSCTNLWQRDVARACIEHGASVFVGHGTPQLQGIERHQGRPILHGLGSFIFQSKTPPGHYTRAAWQSVIVELDTLTGEVGLVALTLDENGRGCARGIPTLADGLEADAILRHVARLSERLVVA